MGAMEPALHPSEGQGSMGAGSRGNRRAMGREQGSKGAGSRGATYRLILLILI